MLKMFVLVFMALIGALRSPMDPRESRQESVEQSPGQLICLSPRNLAEIVYRISVDEELAYEFALAHIHAGVCDVSVGEATPVANGTIIADPEKILALVMVRERIAKHPDEDAWGLFPYEKIREVYRKAGVALPTED